MDSISIVILNYNTFDSTCQCIESVYSTNKSIQDLEIILVDNGSDENIGTEFNDLFPALKYLKNKNNKGFAKGINLGLELATKEYILLLNSDVIVKENDTLIKCIRKIKELKFPVVLSPALKSESGAYQSTYGRLPTLGYEIMFSLFIYKFLSKNYKKNHLIEFVDIEERLIQNGWLVATFLIFRKELLGLLPEKKLPEETFLYGEELFWGAAWHKCQVNQFYYPSIYVTHLIGQSLEPKDMKMTKKRRAFQIYGEYLYIKSQYNNISVLFFYIVRVFRISILSFFKPELKTIRDMTIDILLFKFVQKYPFVINR